MQGMFIQVIAPFHLSSFPLRVEKKPFQKTFLQHLLCLTAHVNLDCRVSRPAMTICEYSNIILKFIIFLLLTTKAR
jgi:hypothetical protein